MQICRILLFNRSLGLQTHGSQSAVELLLTQPELLNSLRKAHMGNYGIILSLLGCIDELRQAFAPSVLVASWYSNNTPSESRRVVLAAVMGEFA